MEDRRSVCGYMLATQQQTWSVVDLGGRWIKCARYELQHGTVRESGSQLIDIQAEGLLSGEEIGTAIGRVLRPDVAHPLAVVLPQSTAVSQIMDLPGRPAGERLDKFEADILELIGLRSERCVYDSHPLKPFGGYAGPQWISVAKEKELSRQLAPLLGQGLRIEAVTTVGNALVAAFTQLHPGVQDAYLVDIGATQTTLVRLQRGEPVQMTSLAGGGERWTDALVESSGEPFEDVEMRLFEDDPFADPDYGRVLQAEVGLWRERIERQVEEWRGEFGMPEDSSSGSREMHLFGGYAALRGLQQTLAAGGGATRILPQPDDAAAAPVWTPGYGAVLMAAGISGLQGSILPQALAKMRQRRLNLERLKTGVLSVFVVLAVVLTAASIQQQRRVNSVAAATRQAQTTLVEVRAAVELLEQRDQLAARIEPIVLGRLKSLNSLETFRRIQLVQQELDFSLIRFVDRETYFQGLVAASDWPASAKFSKSAATDRAAAAQDPQAAAPPQAFVVELSVPGEQAEQLQVLGDIAGRLREDDYFANVDRLVGGRESALSAKGLPQTDEAYALLLTLADAVAPAPRPARKGAGR